MTANACVRCGRTAEGYAYINDDRYCHGDFPGTCFERAQWEAAEEMMDGWFADLEID